jgi:flagellar motor protein MotB
MIRQSRGRSSTNVDEENPYWISFSDIMSGLLVIFILASLVLILQLMDKRDKVDSAIEELQQAVIVKETILTEIQQELKNHKIIVEIIDNKSVLRIPDEELTFGPDKYDVPTSGEAYKRAEVIGRVLYAAVTKDDRQKHLDTVFIEGHTDSQRSRVFKEMGNWGLSTFRAIAVWKFWNNQLGNSANLSTITNHAGKPLFSVSGYAAQRRLVEPELTNADLQKNRRIDIRFTVKSPNLSDYKSARGK